jgi:hypothetical protein
VNATKALSPEQFEKNAAALEEQAAEAESMARSYDLPYPSLARKKRAEAESLRGRASEKRQRAEDVRNHVPECPVYEGYRRVCTCPKEAPDG